MYVCIVALIVTVLGRVGGAPGGETARRRFIGGGRVNKTLGMPSVLQDASSDRCAAATNRDCTAGRH